MGTILAWRQSVHVVDHNQTVLADFEAVNNTIENQIGTLLRSVTGELLENDAHVCRHQFL
jgi:hypothetical protein